MANIGNIYGTLRIRNESMKRDLDQAKRNLNSFSSITSRAFKTLRKSVLSVQGAIAGIAAGLTFGKLAKDTIQVAAGFEKMQIQLDTLTNGRGIQTLERINKWALEMPVNTQEAVKAFTRLQAFGVIDAKSQKGLDDAIEKMQVLTDVATIFGDDALRGVSLALGQMQALGKVSAQDLNQLANVGINARKIIMDTFGMTVEELQKSNIAIEQVIDAIWNGMRTKFQGAAKAGMSSWQGLTATFKSYVVEIQRVVANAGIFDLLKDRLKDINSGLSNWLLNNQELIRQNIPKVVKGIELFLKGVAVAARLAYESIGLLSTGFKQLGTAGYYLLGGAFLDKQIAKYEELNKVYTTLSKKQASMRLLQTKLSEDARTPIGVPESGISDRLKQTPMNDMFTLAQKQFESETRRQQFRQAAESTPSMLNMDAYQNFLQRKDELTLSSKDFAIKQFTEEMRKFEEMAKRRGDDSQEMLNQIADMRQRGLQKIEQDYKEINAATEELGKTGKNTFKELENAVTGWASSFSGTLTDVLFGTEVTFQNILRSFAKMITQMAIQTQIIQPLMSGLFGGGGGFLSGLFGGKAATGGKYLDLTAPVKPTLFAAEGGIATRPTPGIFGEAGAEALIPLDRLHEFISKGNSKNNNGEEIKVTQVINMSPGLKETVRAELLSMMPNIKKAASDAVLNARRRGGSMATAMNSRI